MKIATRLAQKVTEKQGQTWMLYVAMFLLGYIAAKVVPKFFAVAAWCVPIV